jgi:hypothetical protein
MKRLAIIAFAVLLVVLLMPPQAAAWGIRGGDARHFHHGPHFHHFHRHPFHHRVVFIGVGAFVAAPLWYPAAVPVAAPPVIVEPPPVYWYYCQDSRGYYPYVQQCPGGWLTVVPSSPSP